jgi:hypothetical protein
MCPEFNSLRWHHISPRSSLPLQIKSDIFSDKFLSVKYIPHAGMRSREDGSGVLFGGWGPCLRPCFTAELGLPEKSAPDLAFRLL